MAKADFPESYKDATYAQLDAATEQKLGLPVGLLASVRGNGERSNHSATNELGTKTVYQFIPATRKAILDKYGIDVTLSPQNASEGAGLLLKEGLDRNKGDAAAAVGEYIGGIDRANWGRTTNAYINRVMGGQNQAKTSALENDFAKWMAANPAVPSSSSQAPTSTPAPSAKKDALAEGFGAWLQAPNPTDRIPVSGDPAQDAAMRAQLDAEAKALRDASANRSITDKALGAGEAGLSAITGATGGTLGMIGGTLKGLAEQILSGQFGTQQAADLVEQSASQGAQALTYSPRTPTGQEYTENVGNAMQQLIPIAPLAAEGAALSRGAAPVSRAVGDAGRATQAAAAPVVSRGVQAVRSAPQAAVDAVMGGRADQPTPGTGGSVGAAGTDMALQRKTLAESLPVPVQLTKGQASRDAAQLKFEVETAKLPEEGARLRERYVQQNDAILRNMDTWIDQTGAQAPSLRAVGMAVDEALVKQSKRDKAEVNAAYTKAKKSPEAQAIVDQTTPVQIGEGDSALTSTPIEFLNAQPSGLPNTALADSARQYALRIGVAGLDESGQLVPKQATIRQLEDWRKSISQATGYEPTDIRQSTILKQLIDGQTEPVAGPLFRNARNLRARYAQNYENRAAVSKLLSNKRGTTDRQVAFEDVFDHSVLKGSLDDVRNVRRVLQRSGEDGMQAWRELQGQTVAWIRDQATKNVQSNAAGARVVSPAALTKAIRELDVDGRLDFILGKRGAQNLRDLADLAEYAKTVPPEAAVNNSNTAATLLAAFADIAFSGFTGTPAPVTTATRLALKHIKDVKLRRRISDALDEAEKRAPGRRRPAITDPSNQGDPQQAPARTIH